MGGGNDEEDSGFERENILSTRTFTVEESEKFILTMEAGAFAHFVDIFSKIPYIHVTQTIRFDGRALEAL